MKKIVFLSLFVFFISLLVGCSGGGSLEYKFTEDVIKVLNLSDYALSGFGQGNYTLKEIDQMTEERSGKIKEAKDKISGYLHSKDPYVKEVAEKIYNALDIVVESRLRMKKLEKDQDSGKVDYMEFFEISDKEMAAQSKAWASFDASIVLLNNIISKVSSEEKSSLLKEVDKFPFDTFESKQNERFGLVAGDLEHRLNVFNAYKKLRSLLQ